MSYRTELLRRDLARQGIRLHPLAGTLHTLMSKPVDFKKLGPPVDMLPLPLRDIYVITLESGVRHTSSFGYVLATLYGTFQREGQQGYDLMAAVITALCCVTDFESLDQKGRFQAACGLAGFNIRLHRRVDDRDVAEHKEQAADNFLATFNTREEKDLYLHNWREQMIMLGVILITMGIRVTSDNYDEWVFNKIRKFCVSMGINPDTCCWTEDQWPTRQALRAFNIYMSAWHELRMRIFKLCYSLSKSSHSRAPLFVEVINMLRYSEMSHIVLIDIYLFRKYPQLLNLRPLYAELDQYDEAISFYLSKPEEERPFIKLLYNKEETYVLNPSNFRFLTAAAFIIASTEESSLHYLKEVEQLDIPSAVEASIRSCITFCSRTRPTSPPSGPTDGWHGWQPMNKHSVRSLISENTKHPDAQLETFLSQCSMSTVLL